MWKKSKIFLIFFILFLSLKAESQNLITTFTDPCTKATTTFTIPVNGPTVIFFHGQSRQFTATDVTSGAFSAWINQVYSDYRKVSPCSVQQTSITRNQITSQMVSNVVSSVIGSLNSSMSSGMVSVDGSNGGGGNDNASKGKTNSDKKKTNKNESSNNSNSNTSSSGSNSGNATTNTTSGGSGTVGSQQNSQSNQTTSQQSGGSSQGSSSNSGSVGSGNGGTSSSNQTTNNQSTSKTEEKGETVATTVMNVDVRNDKGSDNSSSGGGSSKKSSSSQSRSNPIIVSSDLTSAQNLDRSFTGIINVGMSQSSMTGTSSWGVTSMVWFNLKQFALNGRYTMMKMNNKGTLKFVHNINLTGAYSYGNIFGFVGYSIIVNAGKWGITGGNISGAITKTPDDKNLFISPSITAFYTKPFSASKKLSFSPEIYLISTPVVYSSVDKITVTDRYFSAFLGTGADFQLTRRFKINVNYKANLSTNPEFPILSFFLIGSKINL